MNQPVDTPVVPLETLKVNALTVQIYESPEAVAWAGSQLAKNILKRAVDEKGHANAIFATGRSQVQCLSHLTDSSSPPPWHRIRGFHLDEYLGISADHPASFRHYLKQHLTSRVSLAHWHSIEGDSQQPLSVCESYANLLHRYPADLCCLGVGNNGHLAFNDPGVADFSDRYTVKLVRLDKENRQQQVESGHFSQLSEVPQYAFTLTLTAIQKAANVICLAYGERKSHVVNQLLTDAVDERVPASILRRLTQATLLIDEAAANSLD